MLSKALAHWALEVITEWMSALLRRSFCALPLSFVAYTSRANAMQSCTSDGAGGDGVHFIPDSGKYKNVVVCLHGLGDSADDWVSLVPELLREDTKFIIPTAKARPVTFLGGHAMPGWSDVYGITLDDGEDREGFDKSAARIKNFLQKEIDHGVEPSRMVLVGFSQGGALALHVALRSSYTLGGVVALSTWVPLRDDYPSALSSSMSKVPVLQIHGDQDADVEYEWGRTSHEILRSFNIEPEPAFVTMQGMGHSIDPEEIKIVKAFIQRLLDTPS